MKWISNSNLNVIGSALRRDVKVYHRKDCSIFLCVWDCILCTVRMSKMSKTELDSALFVVFQTDSKSRL